MANHFSLKKNNYLSIRGNNPTRCKRLCKWIRYLNEHSYVKYALTANTMLNKRLLEHVHTTCKVATEGENTGFKFKIGEDEIRISEDDLNEFLELPREDLIDEPTLEELLEFFTDIYATLENGKIPRRFYKNHLPKEWNIFFTIISYVFSPKTGGFHGLNSMVQKIGVAVVHDLKINLGRMLMDKFWPTN